MALGVGEDDVRHGVPRVVNANQQQGERCSADDKQGACRIRAKKGGDGEGGIADSGKRRVPQPILPDRFVCLLAQRPHDDDRGIGHAREANHSERERQRRERRPRRAHDRGDDQRARQVHDRRCGEGVQTASRRLVSAVGE